MDSIISLGQKNTLAEYMSDADNRPPMLDKDLKFQADCDMKATNIILQGLPADIYSLVNHHRVAKDLWERVQLLNAGLPPDWSKFVTDVSFLNYLHTNNFDQFHANPEQHELYANEVYSNESSNFHQTSTVPQVAYQSPQVPTQLVTESPFVDSGSLLPIISSELLLIRETKPLFKMEGLPCNKFRGDKGKIIIVLPIRVMLQIQGEILQVRRQELLLVGKELLNATTAKVKDIWLDPGIPAGQAQTIIPHNDAFQTEDLDSYDSESDDLSTAQVILMANISNYGSDIILEVPNSKTYLNDMDNQSVHALQDFEQSPVMDFTNNEMSEPINHFTSYYVYME
ncbi:hypothetical protein Tco_0705840 [Tanacetum coccineum]|uniref:Uncharacterized protein n=1 Tax=Tanacetum coccineum TaxID=301880 RepID=A0ABQ4Y5Q2_9ASTR